MKTLMRIISNRINGFARYWAVLLGQKSEKLSWFQKKLYLFLFCMAFGGTSTSILLYTLSRGRGGPPLRPKAHIPKHIGKTNELPVKPYIPDTSYKHVEAFKRYLDSLSRNDKIKFQQIIGQRPGLMDSIRLFEKLYLSQPKNKNGN